jgi:methionyl-tRNA formyltransferase
LDFNQSAELLARKVRAYNPWPGTFTSWKGKLLKIHEAHSVESTSPGSGKFSIHKNLPAIGTSNGLLVLDQLQPAGKKSMPGIKFLLGAKNWGK